MLQVQTISCTNHAAFVMNFSIQWLESNSGEWHTSDWNSGNYPIQKSQTSPDLASIGVPSDALAVTPYVVAILGLHHTGNRVVGYAANGQNATYEVKGTTLDYSVKLVG